MTQRVVAMQSKFLVWKLTWITIEKGKKNKTIIKEKKIKENKICWEGNCILKRMCLLFIFKPKQDLLYPLLIELT